MSTHRFATGAHFTWQDTGYIVKRLLPGSLLLIENVQTTESQQVSFLTLAHALFAGELHFSVATPAQSVSPPEPAATLADYPPHLRALAEYRLKVIRPLLALSSHERSRARVAARVAEIQQAQQADATFPSQAISVTSVYRWLRAYQQSGHDIRALLNDVAHQGGKHQARLVAEVETLIHTVIQDRAHCAETVTSDDLYLEIALRVAEANQFRPVAEHLPTPSRVTVWRRATTATESEPLITRRRAAGAPAAPSQLTQMTYPSLPLARVEIDHTRLDLIVVDATDNLPLGRPTLTYCLDTTTRYPLGYYLGFEPPSYLTVMACLYHALLPKGDVRAQYGTQHAWLACGIPSMLATDNGKEFIGRDLVDACLMLGIELQQMPLRCPQFKAAVERMFATLNTGLLHTLPGTTFSNPQQRGDYASAAAACMDLADLEKVLHLFLLDVYAEDFHHGLGDIPARRWEALTQAGFFPRLPASQAEAKILLGRVAHRVIQPQGIEWLHLHYNAAALAPIRKYLAGTPAKIKYDPSDLGCLYVYDPQQARYLRVACLDQSYAAGLSLWKHRVILHQVRQEQTPVDQLSLARAKRQIQEIVAQSKADKKTKSRARIARWETPEATPVPPRAAPTDTGLSLPELRVALDELDTTEWSASYDLPTRA